MFMIHIPASLSLTYTATTSPRNAAAYWTVPRCPQTLQAQPIQTWIFSNYHGNWEIIPDACLPLPLGLMWVLEGKGSASREMAPVRWEIECSGFGKCRKLKRRHDGHNMRGSGFYRDTGAFERICILEGLLPAEEGWLETSSVDFRRVADPSILTLYLPRPTRLEQSLLWQNGQLKNLWFLLLPSKQPLSTQGRGKFEEGGKQK